ncbi:MAG: 4-hydroxythreonine-4-phosphate dehydrogenase PdxA [Roseibacillus sp.]|nr:4-hydroxythreonine-4-phosphate dehydrogenase PdxA [Roseibacillus sp.]
MDRPRIAVTMGDPAGVGPEICLDLLRNAQVADLCIPIVLGDAGVLTRCAEKLGSPAPGTILELTELATAEAPSICDLGAITLDQFSPGKVCPATGRATYRYLVEAIDACLRGDVDAVTTAPANKGALHSAGISQPGQTEIFAERTGAEGACMMLTSDVLTCSFVTVHVGYHEVPALLSIERILGVIELTHQSMKRLRGGNPKLAVCGLNPHAGENGLFGDREEERIIAPAIEKARSRSIDIEGPLPPDTAFLEERRATTDAFICMYHDQGHIPLKALAFDRAINCTLGLPIVRTSVDHGTALDLAWQGKASSRSLLEAVTLAARLCR